MKSFARISRTLQNRMRQQVNPLVLRRFCHGIDLRQTVVIAGSNRSGTTWVQETIAAQPGLVSLFEPCHVDVIPAAREAGFHKLIWKAPGTPWPDGEAYLKAVLSGREWHWYTAFLNRTSRCLRPRRLVVKFIHGNGLIDWMTNQFEIPPPLVLIRHPCAVIASVLNLNWDLRRLQSDLLRSELAQTSTRLQRFIASLQTPLEQLAARWCLENAVLLRTQQNSHARLMTYESLLLGGAAAMEEIFRMWNLPIPANLETASRKDSRLSAYNRTYSDAHNRLTSWKANCSPEQTRVILRILGEFGLDFYSEDPLPDEDRLARCRADGLLNEAFERLKVA